MWQIFWYQGGEELRNIRANCLTFNCITDDVTITFAESTSKCVDGGLLRKHLPKTITFSEKSAQKYSFYRLFKKYLQRCPEDHDRKNSMWLKAKPDIYSIAAK